MGVPGGTAEEAAAARERVIWWICAGVRPGSSFFLQPLKKAANRKQAPSNAKRVELFFLVGKQCWFDAIESGCRATEN
jgi:hypothetical protein